MNSNEIIIPCRVSYEHVWEAKSVNGGAPKFSVCCIIPKSDAATIAKLTQLIEQVKQGGIGKWGGKIPATLKIPLRDGDADHPEDENYKGAMFLNANSDRQPSIIDRHCQPVMDQDEVYSGCYANVKLSLFAYNAANGASKGVGCGLVVVQKTKDGQRLAGGTGTEGFGEIDGDDDDASYLG